MYHKFINLNFLEAEPKKYIPGANTQWLLTEGKQGQTILRDGTRSIRKNSQSRPLSRNSPSGPFWEISLKSQKSLVSSLGVKAGVESGRACPGSHT